ncbi:MAG: hypothetical protein PSX80_12575 [bacterium]|nr:hypothetical protein [bacterium]
MNVGIAFVTGRKHFQNVLRSYVNNWLEHGLIDDKSVRLHLFVVYDVNYHDTEPSDYKNIPPELTEMVESVNFYGRKALKQERDDLVATGVIDQHEGDLLFGEGYAKKRNAALYFASKKGMDRLLFIDDDEYPIAVLRNKPNNLVWMGQSVLGTHMRFGNDADITHGHHCGYISPIPRFEFNEELRESDFRDFIDATSNDILSWESVKKTIIGNSGVTYADGETIDHQKTCEVEEVMGMKFISGANLCFNLRRLKTLPVFYNPPGARGEDAFMSTTLTDHKVVRVPCYTFHDAFLGYKNILNGVLPIELGPVDAGSPSVRLRFIKAAIGWIRYKPLLTLITQPEKYDSTIEDVRGKLDSVVPKLCKYFGTDQFEEIRTELDRYHRNVRRHHRNFEATRRAWTKVSQMFLPVSFLTAFLPIPF